MFRLATAAACALVVLVACDTSSTLPPADARLDGIRLALEDNLGKACVQSWRCKSTYCAQRYCCESACGETCRSCALPSSQGRCELVPAGGDDPSGKSVGIDNR